MITIFKLIFILSLTLLWSCEPEVEQEEITFVKPANFPEPAYNLKKNPITTAGFELGRTLFYDPMLSRDGSISCGSCHQQSAAFTHHGHDLSHGIDDLLGERNSPPVMNLAWHTTFFWDGGVHDLDLQPIAPIENPVEMDQDMKTAVEKVSTSSRYAPMFKQAFGSSEVTTDRVLKALSQFMLMCISADSRYDKYVRKEAGGVLNATELAGMQVFQQKCASCHKGELFSDFSFRNNGLSHEFNKDRGRYRITLNEEDDYKFKVPSLRNVVHTGPYMHDGRFYTLDEVLIHYTLGIKDQITLDPLLKKNGKLGIKLSKEEKEQIKAFLQTLSDDTFLRDKKLAEQ
jgi:cytochrome c peroxidase